MIQYYNRDGTPMIPLEGESDSDLMLRWAKMFEHDNRIVAQTTLPISKYLVSTVFLGLNHQFDTMNESPRIFETIVFGDEVTHELLAMPEYDITAKVARYREDLYMNRYANEYDAIEGHWRTVWRYFWIGLYNKLIKPMEKLWTNEHE